MKMFSTLARLLQGLALVSLLSAASVQAQDAKPFSNEQLDQMTAQVALYPDSLLAQLFMATTYPDEFAAAYRWSKAHPDSKGDDAVRMVENENWDPSVASMVGFPEVIITLGEKPEWVKNMGDAFLAQPEDVMNSVQRLRTQAQKAGNLKTNEQVKVSTEATVPAPSATTTISAPPPQVIVIEPAQPSVVYVPAYNPTVVYGAWPYPAYPPYYYPPPPGYWFSRTVATGIAWGVGIGVSNAMWGGMNWGRGDVDINVNRYNNINVNNRIEGNGNKNWNHNTEHRKTDYRGGNNTKQNLDKKYQSGNREQYRGKDTGAASRDASRAKASQAMESRGVDAGSGSARDRAQTAGKDFDRSQAQGRGGDGGARERAQSADRSAAAQRAQSAGRDNAFKGADRPQAKSAADRGAASAASANRGGGGGGAAAMQRSGGGGGAAAQRSSGGGGAARASGGGGGRPAGGGGGGGGRKR